MTYNVFGGTLNLALSIYGEKGWKEQMGKVFIKTDILGRPQWGIGEG